jgi:hypothetical protein
VGGHVHQLDPVAYDPANRVRSWLRLPVELRESVSIGRDEWMAGGPAEPSKVKGEFTLQFHPPGEACGDHPGPCLTGIATGDLSGIVTIDVASVLPVVGTARTVTASTATIRIERHDGVLEGAAAGFLDRLTGEFRNVTAWVGGSGPYEEADGYVRVEGRDTPEGVEHSHYEGFLHLPKKDEVPHLIVP